MRVLFQSRSNLLSVPGGDTIQMLKTAEYLRMLGCVVDVSTALEPDVSEYDIVHVFNLMRPQDVYFQVRNAKRYRKPVALSTIYGRYTEYDRVARRGIQRYFAKILAPDITEYLKILARSLINNEINKGTINLLLRGYGSLQRRIVKLVDIFLPNSESEITRVISDFNLLKPDYAVVPNAVDISVFDHEKVNVADEVKKYEGCILCVARIEGRKNQLNLVRAIKDLKYKLVLIGMPAPNHMGYFYQIKKEMNDNVHILDHVSQEELAQYYKVAKVHCLPSWMETPGLSSLEAVAMGCNIVVTEKGDTRDYFGDYAYYCDPNSVESIRNAVITAYEGTFNRELKLNILNDYTWEKAAEKTYQAYQAIQ